MYLSKFGDLAMFAHLENYIVFKNFTQFALINTIKRLQSSIVS